MSKRVSNKKGIHQGARCESEPKKYVKAEVNAPIADFVIEKKSVWKRAGNIAKNLMRRHQGR